MKIISIIASFFMIAIAIACTVEEVGYCNRRKIYTSKVFTSFPIITAIIASAIVLTVVLANIALVAWQAIICLVITLAFAAIVTVLGLHFDDSPSTDWPIISIWVNTAMTVAAVIVAWAS